MRKASLISATLFASMGVAHAEPSGEPVDGEVRVRGASPGGFVSEMREADSPRELTDVGSLVAPLPGVHVRRLGSDDSFATMSIRGSSSTQVAIVLAGVPLTGGADPSLDLATLPLWPGARARVFRSFGPATLGRGSLGGVMVLDPPSPTGPARSEVWSAVGSFGAARLRVGDVRHVGSTHMAVAVSASRSDDDFTYVAPLSPAGDPSLVTRENAGHAAASALASVQMPVVIGTKHGAVRLTTLAQGRRQELPGNARTPTRFQRLDSSRIVQAVELTVPLGKHVAFARGWGRREGLELRDSVQSARTLLSPSSTDDAIIAAGGTLGLRTRPSPRSSLDVAVDGSLERFAPGTWLSSVAPPGARRASTGLSADGRARIVGPWSVLTGGRLDLWHDSSRDTAVRDQTSLRPTGMVGSELALGRTIVTTHGGAVARPPSFLERYGNRGGFLGDPRLKSERAVTVDLGAHRQGSLGPLHLYGELAAFSTWANDLIVFVAQGAYGRARATNIGTANIRGFEALARATLGPGALRVSYTGLDARNTNACTATPGTCERPPLPGRPAHDIVADGSLTIGPVRARYGVDVVAGLRADLVGSIRVPNRVIHSAGLTWNVAAVEGLTLGADVRNLFDLRSASYAGALGPVLAPIGDAFEYPLPGRRFMVTARLVTNR